MTNKSIRDYINLVSEAEGDPEGLPHLTPELAGHIAQQIDTEGAHAIVKSVEWGDGAAQELIQQIKAMLQDFAEMVEESAAWQRKAGKNKTGGLNQKGVDSYRREHPGSHLQTAVTTKPSKLKPGSKAAKRRKSFCARMGGMKGPMKDEHGKPTRKALALRKWNCESVEQMGQLLESKMESFKQLSENFKDGRHPEDKGDSKRLGVPTKASVSTLRKVAKQGGRKGQLAHWMANMKSGRQK